MMAAVGCERAEITETKKKLYPQNYLKNSIFLLKDRNSNKKREGKRIKDFIV